jgi:hypothetical protein
MSEPTPRESLSEALSRVFEMGTLPNFLREADALLADPDFCRWLASVKADAWDEGALWSAVECGAIRNEQNSFLAPGDNPWRGERE